MLKLPLNEPQYFFDNELIGYAHHLSRRWQPAKIFPRPVIEPEPALEGTFATLYGTVFPDQPEGWRMYYTNFRPGHGSELFLATSSDGLHWAKPELGLVEWHGGKANNLVLATDWHMDSPSLIYEPEDAEAPYKLLCFHLEDPSEAWKTTWGLYGYTSRDGLHFERMPGLRLRAGDRTNLMAEKVDDRYVAFTRRFPPDTDYWGGRAVWRTESDDFQSWTTPELVMTADLDDEPNVQTYGMSAFRRNGWWFGLVDYWHDTPDVIETCLAISRDGKHWTRPVPRQPFIAATYDWNRTWSTCASNGPIILNEQMVFYFGGRWTSHHFDSAQQYGAIGYASLPLDRFCALEALTYGRLDTVPLTWLGGELVLNADTRQDYTSHPAHCNGEITVEVLDADGNLLPDWSGDNRATFCSNTHARANIADGTVRWPNDRKLDALNGQAIRLRFGLEHARLFTITASTRS